MAQTYLPLSELPENGRGSIARIELRGGMLQRLLDMGLTEGTAVVCRLHGPANASATYEIRGAVIALRRADASKIFVRME